MTHWLLIKGKAGLGNRLLSTLCGIAFGRMAGRRIVVDWRDDAYAAPGVNAFHRLFQSPVVEESWPFDPTVASVAPAIWRSHLDWTVSRMIGTFDPHRFKDPTVYRTYCCDLSTLRQAEDVLVYWSYLPKFRRIRRHFAGELAAAKRLPDHALIRSLMDRYVALQPHIAAEIDAFAAARFCGPMIGVHVRQSDRSTPLARLRKDVATLLARAPSATIFLATDNLAIQRQFEQSYPNVVVTDKWLPAPGEAVHYNRADADPERSAIEALKDIYLLSRCDYLIYPRGSTFSYLARCLGGFADGNVIDVERHAPIVLAKRAIHSWI